MSAGPRPPGAPKRDTVASLVRGMIADGTLKPGGAVPSGAELARMTGCHVTTGRAALRALLRDGTLTRGASLTARLRVPQASPASDADPGVLRAALSRTLAARRRAEGLTQPELAGRLGVSLTAVGHAETGRLWQSRDFWWRADVLLGDVGDILRLYDRFAAAGLAPEEPAPAGPEAPDTASVVLPASVTITPDGVAIVWPDGTDVLVQPPGCQDCNRSEGTSA